MEPSIKDNGRMERSMDKASWFLKMLFISKTGDRYVLAMEDAMNEARHSNCMMRLKYIKSALKSILDAKKAMAVATTGGGGGM